MSAAGNNKDSKNLIDPIYQKFTRSIVRALGSTEFYEFFMDNISRAENEFQFSNRRMEKAMDTSWVDAVEEALEGFQNIIMSPRNIIREDEIIVNVAHAKKAGPDVVRHLAQHGSFVEDFNEETGEVRPSKLMQKIREDSTEFYENRLAFTILEDTYRFVNMRHSAMTEALSEEYGAKLKVKSTMETDKETVFADVTLRIKEKDNILETDEKHQDELSRVSRLNRILGTYMDSKFAEGMKKYNRARGNIVKTNVLKNNPNYRKLVELWEFLREYEDVGYTISVTEQNPYIDDRFQQDIYHNIMFQYIILKGYLDKESERELPEPFTEQKKELKPKFIHEIIEELTEDYDLPDVEVRKVLIEELTKEQLMLEEEAERRRLVEEQEQRRREEEKRRREEERRIREEEEAEARRLMEEQEAKEKHEAFLKKKAELDDKKQATVYLKLVQELHAGLLERFELREEEAKIWNQSLPMEDFANAAKVIQDEEQRQWEAEERMRRQQEEAEARRKRKEEERLEKERKAKEAELERIRQEEEAEQLARDREILRLYLEEVQFFYEYLDEKLKQRVAFEEAQETAAMQAKAERQAPKEQKQKLKWRFGIR